MHGAAANEVAGNDELKAKLRKNDAEYAQSNKERSEKRASKIEEAGQFRAMTSRGGAFTRGFKPRYEGVLRQVGEVKGARVTDKSGNSLLTKFVQPVKEATADTGPARIEQRGSVQTRTRQTRTLQHFADRLKQYLQVARAEVSSPRVLKVLRELSTPTAFRSAVAEAQLNTSSIVKNFC